MEDQLEDQNVRQDIGASWDSSKCMFKAILRLAEKEDRNM